MFWSVPNMTKKRQLMRKRIVMIPSMNVLDWQQIMDQKWSFEIHVLWKVVIYNLLLLNLLEQPTILYYWRTKHQFHSIQICFTIKKLLASTEKTLLKYCCILKPQQLFCHPQKNPCIWLRKRRPLIEVDLT